MADVGSSLSGDLESTYVMDVCCKSECRPLFLHLRIRSVLKEERMRVTVIYRCGKPEAAL